MKDIGYRIEKIAGTFYENNNKNLFRKVVWNCCHGFFLKDFKKTSMKYFSDLDALNYVFVPASCQGGLKKYPINCPIKCKQILPARKDFSQNLAREIVLI